MTTSKRLAAFRAACPAEDEPDEDDLPPTDAEDDGDDDDPKTPTTKDKTMSEPNTAALDTARAEGHAAGFSAANTRFNTVLASEHYEGRETLAKTLLGNDKLEAEEIVAALAVAPKAAPQNASGAGDDDAAARAEMRKNLASEQPGNVTEAEGNDDLEAEDDSLVQGMKARFSNAK